MALNPAKVALAVQGGLSIVCATCQRYWEGRDKQLPGDRCAATTPCGSPLAGDDFHEYHGPMTDFARWCFVCGEAPSHAIQLRGSVRRFGVCKRHLQALPEVRPLAVLPPQAAEVADHLAVVTAGGQVQSPKQAIGFKRKTLQEAIAETEADFAKARAARGEEP